MENSDYVFQIYLKYEYINIADFFSLSDINNLFTSSLSKKIFIDFFKELHTINQCLKHNYIYHNDLHKENVYVKLDKQQKIDKILILDYGEATARKVFPDDRYIKSKLFTEFLPDHNYDIDILQIRPQQETLQAPLQSHTSRVRKRLTQRIKNLMIKPKNLSRGRSLSLNRSQTSRRKSTNRPKSIGGTRKRKYLSI